MAVGCLLSLLGGRGTGRVQKDLTETILRNLLFTRGLHACEINPSEEPCPLDCGNAIATLHSSTSLVTFTVISMYSTL